MEEDGDDEFIMWAHLEEDGVTIQGFADFDCNIVLRGKYKGRKQDNLALELKSNPDEKTKFDALRDAAHQARMGKQKCGESGYVIPSQADMELPKRTVAEAKKVKETYHLQGDLIYPRAAFVTEYKMEPAEMGKKQETINLPNGTVIVGFRVPDHGRRPLPPDVISVSRSYEKELKLDTLIDDGTDTWDNTQQRDNFLHLAKQRYAPTAGTSDDLEKRRLQAMQKLAEVAEQKGSGEIEIDPTRALEAHFEDDDPLSALSSRRGKGAKSNKLERGLGLANPHQKRPRVQSAGTGSTTGPVLQRGVRPRSRTPPARRSSGAGKQKNGGIEAMWKQTKVEFESILQDWQGPKGPKFDAEQAETYLKSWGRKKGTLVAQN